MGGLVTLIALLGAFAGPGLARALRRSGPPIQRASAWLLILAGGALIFAGLNPGFFDSLLLR